MTKQLPDFDSFPHQIEHENPPIVHWRRLFAFVAILLIAWMAREIIHPPIARMVDALFGNDWVKKTTSHCDAPRGDPLCWKHRD